MALLTELLTQVNKNLWEKNKKTNKNTNTGMQKQNGPPQRTQTSFLLTDFIQLVFSLE